MAIAGVQASGKTFASATTTYSPGSNVTAGNYLLFGVVGYDTGGNPLPPAAATVTQSAGTATLGPVVVDHTFAAPYGTGSRFTILRALVTGSGSLTVTVDGKGSIGLMGCREVSCAASVIPYFTPEVQMGFDTTNRNDDVYGCAGGWIFQVSAELDSTNFTFTFSDTSVFNNGSTSALTGAVQDKAVSTDGVYSLTASRSTGTWAWGALSMSYRDGPGPTVASFAEWHGVPQVDTTFPLDENPISEGGVWDNGAAVGVQWNNSKSLQGVVTGLETAGGQRDATCIRNDGPWPNDQYAELVVFCIDPGTSFPEVELRTRSAMAANSCTGMEFSCSTKRGTSGDYLLIVRWNGAQGNFTTLVNVQGRYYGAKNGDLLSASSIGGYHRLYRNGILLARTKDTTVTSGQPGFGINSEEIGGANNFKYGLTRWRAGQAAGYPLAAPLVDPTRPPQRLLNTLFGANAPGDGTAEPIGALADPVPLSPAHFDGDC